MQFLKLVREKLAVLHLKDELLHRARQRRLLRRREEAQRDLPAGAARAEAGDPRRDRLAASTSTRSRSVAEGVNALRSPDRAFLVITHYQRLLDYIKPDVVHVLADGRIVESGGPELALELEAARLRLGEGPHRAGSGGLT